MALVLLILFVVVPLAELYVLYQVGAAIGILPTIALLLIDSIIGTMLMKSQGRAAWRRFNAPHLPPALPAMRLRSWTNNRASIVSAARRE